MSEGEELDDEFAIENKIKTVYTTDGQRIIFSDQAASKLESVLAVIEGKEQKIEISFAEFWKKILLEGNYKFQIKNDTEGDYFYVYQRGESQKLKVILLGTPEFTDKKAIDDYDAAEDEIAIPARHEPIDEEEEEDQDIADLAVNLMEGASKRKTNNNKDTKEIDLSKVMYKSRDLGKEINRQPEDETQED